MSNEIQADKLRAVLTICQEMLQSLSYAKQDNIIDSFLQKSYELLRSESSAIFLARQDSAEFLTNPNVLILESSFPPTNKKGIKLKIRSAEGGGLSSYVANEGVLKKFNYEQLNENPYVSPESASFLKSGECYSTIISPLKDRKGVLLGLLRFTNKLNKDNVADQNTSYDEIDESIVRELSKSLTKLLETLRIRDVMLTFMNHIQDTRRRPQIFSEIVDATRDLLRADRCELLLSRGKEQLLHFEAISANEKVKKQWKNQVVPAESFVMDLWDDDLEFSINKNVVSNAQNYYSLDANTRSEIALKIKVRGKKIGVLNLESSNEDWFDQHDVDILRNLSNQAALSIEWNKSERYYQKLAMEVLENQRDTTETILKHILSGISESFGAMGGIFYIYQPDQKNLKCMASISFDTEDLNLGFTHDLTKNSLASYVFNHGLAYYSPDPFRDERVDTNGMDVFNINGPILGIPLKFREDTKGVLVVWGGRDIDISAVDQGRLLPFAKLAAAKIALGEYERERSAAERELKESKDLHESLLNSLPQMIFRKDREGRFIEANESFCKSLGKTIEEIRGKTDKYFYPPESAQKYRRDDEEVMRTGVIFKEEELHQFKGIIKPSWVNVVKIPIRDSENNIVGVQAIFWDITEEKETKEKYKKLVEQSPLAIIIHQDGKLKLANTAAQVLFGYPEEDLLQKSIIELLHPAYRDSGKKRLVQLFRKEEVRQRAEMKVLQKGKKLNEERYVDVDVFAKALSGPKEAQVVFYDRTMIESMFRDINHRVRNGYAEIFSFLLQAEKDSEPHPHIVKTFDSVRKRLTAISNIYAILYWTKDEPKVNMERYFGSLKKEIFHSYSIDTSAVSCNIDTQQIELDSETATSCGLIIVEFLSNSLKHAFQSFEGARIDIILKRTENEKIQLQYADNGCGLDSKQKPSEHAQGLKLVDKFVKDRLEGILSMKNTDGLSFEIDFNYI